MDDLAACRVGAVVVVYYPDCERLRRLLEELSSLQSIVIVKNDGPDENVIFWKQETIGKKNLRILQMDQNSGIAQAINLGVDCLQASEVDYIWTFDQDTNLPSGVIAHLLSTAESMVKGGVDLVAAVVPSVKDSLTRESLPYLIRKTDGSITREKRTEISEVLCAISSGMLIPMNSWKRIGPMSEELFIDHVDTEWCFRAADLNYKIIVNPEAVIEHRLGDTRTLNFLGLKFDIRTRPENRTYYILRNGWRLARLPYCPPSWRSFFAHEARRVMAKALLFGPNRRGQMKAIFRAWIDCK